MPEGIEIEQYRVLAENVVGRRVTGVEAPDAWYLKGGLTAEGLEDALRGRRITGTRRIGKLLLLDTDGPTLGLRFGMTGRLLVDGVSHIEKLEYSTGRANPAWDRVVVNFAKGDLRIRDPRRLGGVLLDPDEGRLGTDVGAVGLAQFRRILESDAPVKARLMDQSRLAGVGNLIADEVLWRAAIDPARPARDLAANEVRRLHKHLLSAFAEMTERGGSHTGDLYASRERDGVCPKDGTPLLRRTVGGRTTYSCPSHQR